MKVTILEGSYRNIEIENEVCELVERPKHTAKGWTITVRPSKNIIDAAPAAIGKDKIRIKIPSTQHVVYEDGSEVPVHTPEVKVSCTPQPVKVETDEEIIARIADRFEILEEMTRATLSGDVRGIIVSGPPGVGKSYGVIRQLEKYNDAADVLADRPMSYEIVKGSMTPIGLYMTLYNRREKGQVLLFDDCDQILQDELSLNLLKAALDSGKRRVISWAADSSALRKEDIPNSFEFHGSVIFITNVKFDNIRSKKLLDHLEALQSRCHYLDLTMDTERDCILRIKQIHSTGKLFNHYRFENNEGDLIVDYMVQNKARLREVSLRMAMKIADLVKVSANNWKRLAETTVMK